MEGVVAVAFLVGCASNLLICEDLPAGPDRFADMAACRTALPVLIRQHERPGSGRPPVVLGKCRLTIGPAPWLAPPDAEVLIGSSR
jgi:hypothetical protein